MATMDVAAWLRGLGLEQYDRAFRDNDIDGEVLPELTDADLEKLGLSLGHRKKLLKAIAALSAGAEPAPVTPAGALLTTAPTPEAERRQLTIMFVDLVGSTALSGRLDPEVMRAVIRAYQDACAGAITRFEGHVAKYLGDGVLAYFGYPRAHEDDAERAVRAGLAIIEAVGELPPQDGLALRVRIGIATGLVVVGELIGEGAAKEEAVVGETPNLAARLQALAEPDTVVIGPSTQRLVDGLFELADLGAHALKGFTAPVRAWRVLGPSAAEGRFEARQAAGLTPLVGREHELGLLLERWQQAKDGEGQVVLLAGEPGIGKSRLVRALREHLAEEPYTPLSHYCSPYHVNSALHPVIDLLERAAGFERGDPPGAKLEKLEALLTQSARNVCEVAPLLAALLAIPAGDRYPPLPLAPQQQRELTLRALVDQLAGLASRRPVLAVYEDVHWADPSTLELLGLIVERVQALPVLALITFRPEFQPPWTGFAHVTSLSLNRLTRRHGTAMVDKVTGGKALPAEVLEQIVAKADGVPLFLEELTKVVVESGLLREAADGYAVTGPLPPLAIPDTLHDSLMARLDRLAPVKEVAQVAACLGREFSHELLAAVAPLGDNALRDALAQLVQSELVFRRGVPPEVTYSFKHALVRDAAYQSLLKSKRQQLHTTIAHVLEERFPEVGEAQPEVLAHHLTEAGLADRAVVYWSKAGHRAAGRSAYTEATVHLRRGLELLQTLPEGTERAHQELDLLTALGSILATTKGQATPDVASVYRRARELGLPLGDTPHLAPVLQGLRLYHMVRGEVRLARNAGEELLRLADRVGDDGCRLEAHRALGIVSFYLGEFVEARDILERGVALYDARMHGAHALRYTHNPATTCLCYLTRALWVLGYPEQALRPVEEAVGLLAQDSAHIPSLLEVLQWRADLFLLRRQVDRCREQAEAVLALASEHGFPFWTSLASATCGWAEAQGDGGEAGIAALRRGLDGLEGIGGRLFSPYYRALLADALWRLGRRREALAELERAMECARGTDARYWDAELHRLRGEMISQLDDAARPQAEACFRTAIEMAQEQNAKSVELRAATSLARLWAGQKRSAEASDLLAPIYGWFMEGFDTQDLQDAKALLDELASTPASSVASGFAHQKPKAE